MPSSSSTASPTPAVWDPLRAALGRTDVEAVRLPGFGSPAPFGFGATKEEYVAWLVGELETDRGRRPHRSGETRLGRRLRGAGGEHPTRPRPLVGHRRRCHRGPRVRVARLRQDLADPGRGRGVLRPAAGHVPRRSSRRLRSVRRTGRPGPAPGRVGRRGDGPLLLVLYRSAVDVGAQWGPDFQEIAAPGLALLPSEDPFLSADGSRRAARRAGVDVVELPGLGHWWMLQDPDRGAAVLSEFWASLP